jgi:CubicO group peptidase (beta-lactamase class C family)
MESKLLLLQWLPATVLITVGATALLMAILAAGWALRRKPASRVGRLVLVGALAGVAACVAGLLFIGFTVNVRETPIPEWSDGSSSLATFLREPCADFVRTGKAVGLVAAIVDGDETCLMGIGRTSLIAGRPVNGDTLFEIGSITKTFTGLLLATEIQRGRLGLERPIGTLLPSTLLPSEAVSNITLRQLVTHSSGLPRLPGNAASMWRGALAMLLYGGDPYAGLTEKDYLRALQGAALEFEPGSRSSYSNFGAALLGWMIARQAGRDYEEMALAEICGPLRMKNTAINLTAQQEENLATGYRAVEKLGAIVVGLRSNLWTSPRDFEGAGGLRSSGADMLAYLRAQMRPKNSPLAASLRQSHEPLFPMGRDRAIAMGWIVSTFKGAEGPIFWHNGGTGGFRSFIGFDESGQHGILILSNSSESVDAIALKILRNLIAKSPRIP